jgi:uncharacterized protein YecE (DUF72 family)
VGTIRVGTAGWTDKALVTAGWYPQGVRTPEQRLRCYAERFDFVEVNSTYYGLPQERNTRAWAQRTPEHFTFNVKAFSLLTHHQTATAMLPSDLRPDGEARVRQRDLAPDVVDEVWARFLDALEPLSAAGKLGLLLFQFPPGFRPGAEAREYLLECRRRAAPFRICVEFRDPAWLSDREREATLGFLAEHDLAFVCVDMPQGIPGSVPATTAVTSADAVVRLHGRSPDWTRGNKEERYRYSYDTVELDQWVERVQRLAAVAETTYVVFNNCYRDSAQVNAAELRTLLDSQSASTRASAPGWLRGRPR